MRQAGCRFRDYSDVLLEFIVPACHLRHLLGFERGGMRRLRRRHQRVDLRRGNKTELPILVALSGPERSTRGSFEEPGQTSCDFGYRTHARQRRSLAVRDEQVRHGRGSIRRRQGELNPSSPSHPKHDMHSGTSGTGRGENVRDGWPSAHAFPSHRLP